MASNVSGPSAASDATSEIMSSVDGDDGTGEYVIADITEDGAWLSMHVDDAPTLAAWR